MRLDVIVPCYGQHKLTRRLMDSFSKCAPDWARMILIDNGKGLPCGPHRLNATVIRSDENLGFVRGVNVGLCASDADYVCIQNNDTEIFSGCYERLIADLEANPGIAVISPVASERGSAWLSIDVLQKRWNWYAQDIPHFHAQRASMLLRAELPLYVHRPSMVPFFCAMMPRATVDEFGLLDTAYGLGLGDDDDYCNRIRAGGKECGLSLRTYVYHKGRATFNDEFTPEEMQERIARATETLARRWPGD